MTGAVFVDTNVFAYHHDSSEPREQAIDAWGHIQLLFAWNPQATDLQLLDSARDIETRYRVNWWDALIVAAAELQDCTTLLTEDLQDGMDFDGVRVRNPFRAGVAEEAPTYSTGPRRVAPANPRHRGRGRPRRQALG